MNAFTQRIIQTHQLHVKASQLENRIFAFWTGDNEMSDNRKRCLDSLVNSECEIVFVTGKNLKDWVLPQRPLHRSYANLSAMHRADYLRAYFMHFHGGGYSDIKLTSQSWLPSFERLNKSQKWGIGYREVSAGGVAHFHTQPVNGHHYYLDRRSSHIANYIRYHWLRVRRKHLIGNCAFIMRPNTAFTERWLSGIETRLDWLSDELEKNPGKMGRFGSGDGYPVHWSYICGSLVHPLAYRYRRKLLRSLPRPSFEGYV